MHFDPDLANSPCTSQHNSSNFLESHNTQLEIGCNCNELYILATLIHILRKDMGFFVSFEMAGAVIVQ